MALKHSLQLESTHWLVVTNRSYYNGFSSRQTLLWIQGHLAGSWEPQNVRAIPRPFRIDEEYHTGAVTYPRSQNINGGKAGPWALGTGQVFTGASMYSWASCALCNMGAICRSHGLPFWWRLLTTKWPMPKWPGFYLCAREVVIRGPGSLLFYETPSLNPTLGYISLTSWFQ